MDPINLEESFSLSIGSVTPMEAALTLGRGLPKEIGGVPCRYFWREFIREGDFVHPKDDRSIEVTPGTLKHWQQQFSRMKDNGVRVTVPVDHKAGTSNNRGYVEELRIRNGKLEGLLQLIGDDAVKDCARSEISIKVDKVKGGKGDVYPAAIVHASLVTDPVITGATTFEEHNPELPPALAASRGEVSDGPTYTYAAPTQEPTMDLSKIRKLVGAAENATDEQVIATAETKLGELATATASVSTLTQEKTQLSRDLDATKLELSRASGGPAKPTSRELRDGARNAKRAREDAIRAGAVTPATADKIEKRFMQKTVDADKLTLSREVEDDDHKLLAGFDQVTDVFESLIGNKPSPKPGEDTPAQFSRHEIDDEKDTAAEEGRKQGEEWKKQQLAARGLS